MLTRILALIGGIFGLTKLLNDPSEIFWWIWCVICLYIFVFPHHGQDGGGSGGDSGGYFDSSDGGGDGGD
jgi:hypothetical protein